jgi:cardiolipin synthase C
MKSAASSFHSFSTAGRSETRSIKPSSSSRLSEALRPYSVKIEGTSGILPVKGGPEALASRLALAGAAEQTINVQYYIWHGDRSGKRLAAELLRAADRGVKVRVLLDDLGSSAKDEGLILLDHHKNVEVRLFNPVPNRAAKLLSMIANFGRTNHRMHNKAFVVDNQAAIVGGRNIGDEYFGADEEMNFADFDVVAAGPVVRELSTSFDAFWNSPLSITIQALTKSATNDEIFAANRTRLESDLNGPEKDPALEEAKRSYADKLLGSRLAWHASNAKAVYDDPAKASGSDASFRSLSSQVVPAMQSCERQLIMVSPYFVPGRDGVARLAELCRKGVQVVILTNSMASNDVPIVHSGYREYRKGLIEAGVSLYEFKTAAPLVRSGTGISATPKSGLHAKTFTFDDKTFYVGSMNLDPRSVKWNTEAGVLVDSPELSARLSRDILHTIENHSFHVTLVNGKLTWTSLEAGVKTSVEIEPQSTRWQRVKSVLLGWLPLEKQI